MVLFIAIIANNTFGLAYFHAKEIVMTADMWGLLKLGIGGYIGCRTIEKGIKILRS